MCLVGRRTETLQAVLGAKASETGLAFCYQADLAIEHDIETLVGKLKDGFSGIDILVHGAGVIGAFAIGVRVWRTTGPAGTGSTCEPLIFLRVPSCQ